MAHLSHREGYLPDFVVRYRLMRTTPLVQGYRCDWMYPDDDEHAFSIWPEFQDDHGHSLLEDAIVGHEGIAQMHILDDEMRQKIHRARIHVGLKGYFCEGTTKIAEAEVIRVIGLHSNP